jgi:hypothetical protein
MPDMVTNETLAAILQRVEDSVADLHRKVERLDNDVRANYVTRIELDRYDISGSSASTLRWSASFSWRHSASLATLFCRASPNDTP